MLCIQKKECQHNYDIECGSDFQLLLLFFCCMESNRDDTLWNEILDEDSRKIHSIHSFITLADDGQTRKKNKGIKRLACLLVVDLLEGLVPHCSSDMMVTISIQETSLCFL